MADIFALLSILDVMPLDPATCCLALSSSLKLYGVCCVLLCCSNSQGHTVITGKLCSKVTGNDYHMGFPWFRNVFCFFVNFSAFSRSDVSAFSRVVSSCVAGLFGMVCYFSSVFISSCNKETEKRMF